MASATCAKGFLLFVCFQMSLLLFVTAQDNNCTLSANLTDTTTNSTTCMTNMTLSNQTTAIGNNGSSLPCQLFTCSYSECSNISQNTNNSVCSGSDKYCELRRTSQGNSTMYSTVCTSSCFKTCANTSQNDCSINCCNSTDCINSTVSSLTNSPLIINTPTASTAPSTTKATTAATVTVPTNGKKCHKLTCTGETCYTGATNVAMCTSTQNFCMLKKTPSGTVVSWTASCIEDCSKEAVCSAANTACILECCNATTTASCLKLNGQVNIFFSGATALQSHVLLIMCSVFLWLLSMGRSYG